ncbi:hypothetical protein RRG08_016861 [Elysia crispata]|uniref:Uncharacterized protein n=1 Tax=Elysia crispata TaxID=231223 RepID=A0AAE0XMR2_9GAST|nr:hypothetical protein RRG08_016861 [Elysia crispata]
MDLAARCYPHHNTARLGWTWKQDVIPIIIRLGWDGPGSGRNTTVTTVDSLTIIVRLLSGAVCLLTTGTMLPPKTRIKQTSSDNKVTSFAHLNLTQARLSVSEIMAFTSSVSLDCRGVR